MPGSFLNDDLSAIFNANEFATSGVIWQGVTIEGAIFDDESIEVETGTGVAEIILQPKITGKSSDFNDIQMNDAISVDGETFRVKNWRPDGTGIIEIFLDRNPAP